jgi:hypothetical protein
MKLSMQAKVMDEEITKGWYVSEQQTLTSY